MTKLKDITIFFNGTDMESTLYRYARNESLPAPLKRAYMLAQNTQGLYYLVYNAKHEKWGLPGGHIEEHESIEQTLNRELQEEVGFPPATYEISYVLAHNGARTEYEVICTGTLSNQPSSISRPRESISSVAAMSKEKALEHLKPRDLWETILSYP